MLRRSDGERIDFARFVELVGHEMQWLATIWYNEHNDMWMFSESEILKTAVIAVLMQCWNEQGQIFRGNMDVWDFVVAAYPDEMGADGTTALTALTMRS